jgi:hypothetical protein
MQEAEVYTTCLHLQLKLRMVQASIIYNQSMI